MLNSLPQQDIIKSQSPRPFPLRRDYASLSMRDLLDAREAYHVYLSTLENVVATAIGRYLIHRDDWYAAHAPSEHRPAGYPRVTEPRTLQNSVVRPWSWPSVLVFVRRWEPPERLGSQEVPRALYLPDGRVVPTCVILAEPDESLPPPAPGPSQTSGLVGDGYSCLRRHQGVEHVGTIGCLVSRGGTYYALTNQHVAGDGGEEIRAFAHGEYHRVGASAGIASGDLRVADVFPAWPGARTYLTLDAGLIRIDDISEWTSVELLAASVRLLADLWISAWQAGDGQDIPDSAMREFSEDEFEAVYRDHQGFVPSLSLDEMVRSGVFEP